MHVLHFHYYCYYLFYFLHTKTVSRVTYCTRVTLVSLWRILYYIFCWNEWIQAWYPFRRCSCTRLWSRLSRYYIRYSILKCKYINRNSRRLQKLDCQRCKMFRQELYVSYVFMHTKKKKNTETLDLSSSLNTVTDKVSVQHNARCDSYRYYIIWYYVAVISTYITLVYE